MKQTLCDFRLKFDSVPIFCDIAINLTKNPIHHSRTKHIDIRHHLNGHIILDFVNANNQLADIFTKSLMKKIFAKIGLSLVLLVVIYLEFYNFVYNFLRHVFEGSQSVILAVSFFQYHMHRFLNN